LAVIRGKYLKIEIEFEKAYLLCVLAAFLLFWRPFQLFFMANHVRCSMRCWSTRGLRDFGVKNTEKNKNNNNKRDEIKGK